MDDGGGQTSAVAAIFAVEILDHLLAPLMLEIDVDIGRFLAVFGDEAVKQQSVLSRIDAGDTQAIAHSGIGGGPAPLTQDRRRDLVAGEIDDILDRQKIARQLHLADQREFLLQSLAHSFGHAFGIAPIRALPCLALQIFLRRLPIGINLFRVFVAQFIQ